MKILLKVPLNLDVQDVAVGDVQTDGFQELALTHAVDPFDDDELVFALIEVLQSLAHLLKLTLSAGDRAFLQLVQAGLGENFLGRNLSRLGKAIPPRLFGVIQRGVRLMDEVLAVLSIFRSGSGPDAEGNGKLNVHLLQPGFFMGQLDQLFSHFEGLFLRSTWQENDELITGITYR